MVISSESGPRRTTIPVVAVVMTWGTTDTADTWTMAEVSTAEATAVTDTVAVRAAIQLRSATTRLAGPASGLRAVIVQPVAVSRSHISSSL